MTETKNQFPLFPELSDQGQKEAVELIEKFKVELQKAANQAIMELYCDIPDFIESDSWGNFRNTIMKGMQNYRNRELGHRYEYDKIRAEIFKQFRDEIIADIQDDVIKENNDLKEQIIHLKSEIIQNRHKY